MGLSKYNVSLLFLWLAAADFIILLVIDTNTSQVRLLVSQFHAIKNVIGNIFFDKYDV